MQSRNFQQVCTRQTLCKFDFSSSENITAFCTHLGLHRYKLNYGMNAAAELFQHTLQQTLQGIKGIKNIADDTVLPRSNLTHAVRSRFMRFAAAVRAVCGYGSCGSRLRFAVTVRAVRGRDSCGSLADCAKIIAAYSDILRALHFIMRRSFGVERR